MFATGAFAVQMWPQQLIPAQQVALIASEPAYAAWLPWYFFGETWTCADCKGIDPDSGADRCVGVTFSRTGRGDDGTGLTTRSEGVKFGNGRWVREGFLDNRIHGPLSDESCSPRLARWICISEGDFKADIAGQVIQFRNSCFEDEELAGQVIGDIESPQIGTVNLISFDPHPISFRIPTWNGFPRDPITIDLNSNPKTLGCASTDLIIDDQSRQIRATLAGRPWTGQNGGIGLGVKVDRPTFHRGKRYSDQASCFAVRT